MHPELLQDALAVAAIALVIYLLLVAVAQLLRRAGAIRFGWSYHLFAAATAAWAGIAASPWPQPWHELVRPHLTAAALILATFPLRAILRQVLRGGKAGPAHATNVPRLLADAINLLVIVAVALAVLQFVYGLKVPGLVAGSGVVAIVLGLAMQDTLGNMVAGIALYFEKSFQQGHWLEVDGVHARVVELSWRSTRLLTNDEVLLDVPNSHIAKQAIANFSLPTREHGIRTTLRLRYDVPPVQAQRILGEAAASVPGVLAHPAPVVYVKELAESAVVYEIKVSIEDHGRMNAVLSELRSHCWYAVRRAGLEIPFPSLTLHRPKPVDSRENARSLAAAALRGHAIFGALAAEELDGLVRRSPVVLFAADEPVIEQGASGDSMYLLVRGRVEVRLNREGRENVVAELGPGECVGEMSLLTGEPRVATVVAREEVEAVKITRAGLAGLLQEHPDIPERLSELLARRQLANEKIAAGQDPVRAAQAQATMLHRLRRFFELGD